jgi:hypothetical protein
MRASQAEREWALAAGVLVANFANIELPVSWPVVVSIRDIGRKNR